MFFSMLVCYNGFNDKVKLDVLKICKRKHFTFKGESVIKIVIEIIFILNLNLLRIKTFC